MEIDEFDDFETQNPPQCHAESSNWNWHSVRWLFDWHLPLHEKLQHYPSSSSLIKSTVSTLFHSNTTRKVQNASHLQSKPENWAAANTLVSFYLKTNPPRKETLRELGIHYVSGRISLNELLAPDYLDREIQIVPFALNWDANLSFIELPEGVSWHSLNEPLAGTFQSYFPHGLDLLTRDRSWWSGSHFHATYQVESYLELVSANFSAVVSEAQTKGAAFAMETANAATKAATRASDARAESLQTTNPHAAGEQATIAQEAAVRAKEIALAAEQESILAEALATAKANAAGEEKEKAIDATRRAILATEPPYLGQPGWLTQPREFIIQEWHKERILRAGEAESQSNIAATAAEEAKIAISLAAGKKQAALVAKEQALIAERAANEASSYAIRFPPNSELYSHAETQSLSLGDSFRSEFTSQLFPQLSLSENSEPTLYRGIDFSALSYHERGEVSLALGRYSQAIEDLGRAIEANPINPTAYLERGAAHFGLGQYEFSLQDYSQFTSQVQNPISPSEFSLGFAKGLPLGTYESGKGFFWFLVDFVQHPIHTSEQVFNSITTLVNLVRSDEWGVIGEVLSPEIYQLVTEWDTLSSERRGELAGFAVGKLGADILIPGALVKVGTKAAKSAQELAAVCKELQIAHETLILETAAGIGDAAKITEVIEAGQKTALFAEELGFTAREIGELKQAGKLEATLAQKYEHLSLSLQESFELFGEAGKKLKPYQGIYMPESKARELIHATGLPTFPRPKGIPDNYRVKLADKPGGIKYVHPTDEGTYVRIMPGKAHSKNPSQQRPYVNQRVNGNSLDKHGNIVSNKSEEAHILLEDFIYRGLGGDCL